MRWSNKIDMKTNYLSWKKKTQIINHSRNHAARNVQADVKFRGWRHGTQFDIDWYNGRRWTKNVYREKKLGSFGVRTGHWKVGIYIKARL